MRGPDPSSRLSGGSESFLRRVAFWSTMFATVPAFAVEPSRAMNPHGSRIRLTIETPEDGSIVGDPGRLAFIAGAALAYFGEFEVEAQPIHAAEVGTTRAPQAFLSGGMDRERENTVPRLLRDDEKAAVRREGDLCGSSMEDAQNLGSEPDRRKAPHGIPRCCSPTHRATRVHDVKKVVVERKAHGTAAAGWDAGDEFQCSQTERSSRARDSWIARWIAPAATSFPRAVQCVSSRK
jgi:hypothetical protein